jgi:hypothetical protein
MMIATARSNVAEKDKAAPERKPGVPKLGGALLARVRRLQLCRLALRGASGGSPPAINRFD